LEPRQPPPYLGILFLLRMENLRQEGTEPAESAYFVFDLLLRVQPVEPSLLTGVGVGLLDLWVPMDQVKPEQLLKLSGVQLPLQRQPEILVDGLPAGG